jgi:hypothetical protein
MPWPFWRWLFAVTAAITLLVALLALAHGHDSWISRGGLKNAAGEWCCGLGDCFVIPAELVRAQSDGYRIIITKSGRPPEPQWLDKRASPFDPDLVTEVVPYAEAQPSPDGAYWRCKKPDGSRRCFFAPPPNT